MFLALYSDLHSRALAIRQRVHTAWERVQGEQGASGVEYGILVAAIAALIVAVALVIGGKIQGAFEDVNAELP
jgi:Flp pilus assembly pilin Flp